MTKLDKITFEELDDIDESNDISQKLVDSGYGYDFEKQTWVKKEIGVVYGYKFKVYVNGNLAGIINEDKRSQEGNYTFTIPNSWYKIGDTVTIDPEPITEPIKIEREYKGHGTTSN